MNTRKTAYWHWFAAVICLIVAVLFGCTEDKKVQPITAPVPVAIKDTVISTLEKTNDRMLRFLECYRCNKDDMALRNQMQIRYTYTGSKKYEKLFYFYQDRANFWVNEQKKLEMKP